MKTLTKNSIVKLDYWKGNFEVAKVHDVCTTFADCPDEERFYASVRTAYITDRPDLYDIEDKKWENPITLTDGEVVRFTETGRTYKVVDMGRGKFGYYQDILHFLPVEEEVEEDSEAICPKDIYDYDADYERLIRNEIHNLYDLEGKVPYAKRPEIHSMINTLEGILSSNKIAEDLSRI